MAFPTGFNHVRSGFVQAGDRIWVPALQQHLEVSPDSIYLGTPVDSHSAVYRADPATQPKKPSFTCVRDRCDHLREHDAVVLREDGYYDNHRVVVYKDANFVYLRGTNLLITGTSDRVCRKTGKAWAWTPTGWEPKQWELRLPEEAMSVADVYMGTVLPKGEQVYFGD